MIYPSQNRPATAPAASRLANKVIGLVGGVTCGGTVRNDNNKLYRTRLRNKQL